MKTYKVPFEPLELPPNDIGWSDESFDLALRYVMHTTSLAEVRDMHDVLRANIEKNIFWVVAGNATQTLFKRPMLLDFKLFEPSVMQDAYNEIKQHPRPRLAYRNNLYHVINVLFVLFAAGFILLVIRYYALR